MNSSVDFRRDLIHDDLIDELGAPQLREIELIELVANSIENHFPLISSCEKTQLANSVLDEVNGYGFLETLWKDSDTNEIMINSSTCAFVDKSGSLNSICIETTNEELVRLIQKIAGSVGARCDASSPILDAWLVDGSRVHCVLPPIAVDGPYLTIRKFISRSFDLEKFCVDEKQVQQVQQLVLDSKNIVVAGGTSSGKTTLLNCLMHRVNENERIISIEETAELKTSHPHWVRLLARSKNSEGAGQISLGDLVKASLRMRPDRIIVGEVRSAEAFDLVQALNTGHDGSLCTIHANGPNEVIHRMASLAMFAHPGLDYQAIVKQICFGIDTIIYVKKTSGGKRCIDSISHIQRTGMTARIVNEETKESVDV